MRAARFGKRDGTSGPVHGTELRARVAGIVRCHEGLADRKRDHLGRETTIIKRAFFTSGARFFTKQIPRFFAACWVAHHAGLGHVWRSSACSAGCRRHGCSRVASASGGLVRRRVAACSRQHGGQHQQRQCYEALARARLVVITGFPFPHSYFKRLPKSPLA